MVVQSFKDSAGTLRNHQPLPKGLVCTKYKAEVKKFRACVYNNRRNYKKGHQNPHGLIRSDWPTTLTEQQQKGISSVQIDTMSSITYRLTRG